jgi:adenosylhomocysteine nucleosidase
MPPLYVMAAEAEYGPRLQARIDPLMTGVGPIEAAIALTNALATMPSLPSVVVSLGSAGSARLEQTAIYQASSVSWRDMDASALGFPKGVTPFLDLPAELALDLQVPGIPSARLSTGADIVTGARYDAIDADMVDMETFALLRVCQTFGVPLIALRGISDGAAELRHMDDWTQYLDVIDARLAEAVDIVESYIAEIAS